MSNGPLTAKTVEVKLTANFYGDYIPADQVDEYLIDWIDSGLYDRDDLLGWSIEIVSIEETNIEGEPE